MTREEFIQILNEKDYTYEIEGDKLVVTGGDSDGYVSLKWIQSIPSGIEFRNPGSVDLESIKEIPADTIFNNHYGKANNVYLHSIKRVPAGLKFNRGSGIYLDSLEGLEPGVEFNNYSGDIHSNLFGSKWFSSLGVTKVFYGLTGINNIMLLNIMIKRGMFI